MGVLDPLFQALGVEVDSKPDDVKKAFRRIARECHPDVAGNDPAKAERFRKARDAYEVLTDDTKRAAFEEQYAPPPPPRARKGRAADDHGAFFRAFYQRASGGAAGPRASEPERPKTHGGTFRARAGKTSGADHLDDLFADFGFGGAGEPRVRTGPSNGQARRGDDVILDLDVAADVARDGGPVLASYAHLARDERWKTGDPSPGVMPRHEQVSLDIPAGSRFGSIIRFRGLGDAGPWGGTPGDLVCRLRVVEEPRRRPEPPPRAGRGAPNAGQRSPFDPEPEAPKASGPSPAHRVVVDITVFEALLGGRIEVGTPSGRVRMAIPPCTDSGKVFRLKDRGPRGIDGSTSDLTVEVRIVTPDTLDADARALVERLAELYPESPER